MRFSGLRVLVVCGLATLALGISTTRLAAEPIGEADLKAAPAPGAAKPADTKQDSELTAADECFRKRDLDGALKALKEAAAKDPELPPAQLLLANMFFKYNIPAGVRPCLEQAAFEAPDDPEAFLYLGETALREQRILEADLLYHKAASLLEHFTRSKKRKEAMESRLLNGLAAVAEAREKWPEAQKEFEAWLKKDPQSIVALQGIARCRFHQKDIPGALEKLREAVKLAPKSLPAEMFLAQLYEQSGDRENAKKWLDAALAAAPDDVRTRFAAAQWAFQNGDLKEAKAQAQAVMKLDPKSMDAKVLCGAVALYEKDYNAAEMYFESAHLQAPGDFRASNYLALALLEQKDEAKKRQGLQYAEANVRQFPKSVDAMATYGWALYKMGRIDEAEKAFRTVATSGNLGPDILFFLARISVDRGRNTEAQQLLERALKATGPFLFRDEAKSLLEQVKK